MLPLLETGRFKCCRGFGQRDRIGVGISTLNSVRTKFIRRAARAVSGKFLRAQRFEAKANCVLKFFDRDAIDILAVLGAFSG